MRRLAGMIGLVAALSLLSAACSDTEKAEGPAGAFAGIEAMVNLAERLEAHIQGVSPNEAPAEYADLPPITVEAFGGAGALAAAGDGLRLQRFETGAAMAARDLAVDVAAGNDPVLTDAAQDALIARAGTAPYDAGELAAALTELVTAMLFTNPTARAALAPDTAVTTIEQFGAVPAVSELAASIGTRLADAPGERVP